MNYQRHAYKATALATSLLHSFRQKTQRTLWLPLLFPCCFADRVRESAFIVPGVFPIVRHPQFPEQLTNLSVECIQGNSEESQCKIVGSAFIGKKPKVEGFVVHQCIEVIFLEVITLIHIFWCSTYFCFRHTGFQGPLSHLLRYKPLY